MKTKKLIALLVVAVMLFAFVASIAACTDTHKCEDVCPECHKCLTDCEEPECAEKCPGHEPGPAHQCTSKCPECGKCLNKDCTEAACANKCPGHEVVDDHVCDNACQVCGGCLTADCGHKDCEKKCEHGGDHGEIVEATVSFNVGLYGKLAEGEEESAQTVNGKLEKLPVVEINEEVQDTATFLGWFTAAVDGEQVDENYFFDVTEEESEVEIFAQYAKEWKVTLNAGQGTLDPEEKTEYITVDGKLPEGTVLPEATIATAHIQFKGWYDAQTNGNLIVEEETVFTKDTVIYARFVRDDGVWIGETFKAALLLNANADTSGTLNAEYWLGDGVTITLTTTEQWTMWVGGVQCTGIYVDGTDSCTGNYHQNVNTISVKAGTVKFYLKDYSTATKVDWVCEFQAATPVTDAGKDAIPAGAGKIEIKIGNLETITLYLQTSAGAAVTEADFGKYCIYTFSDDIFGNWDQSATNGLVKANMTAAGTKSPDGWIIRWRTSTSGSFTSQTGNINNAIEAGGTYVIKLGANQATPTVTRIVESAEESPAA